MKGAQAPAWGRRSAWDLGLRPDNPTHRRSIRRGSTTQPKQRGTAAQHGVYMQTSEPRASRRGGRRWSEVCMRGANNGEDAQAIHTATARLRMGYLLRMVRP